MATDLTFFNRMMSVLAKELDDTEAVERVRFDTHRRRDSEDCISITYDFVKNNGKRHTTYVAVGTSNHVLSMHVDEEDTRNGNENTLTEKLQLLTKEEYELVISSMNTYIDLVYKKKYPKTDDDVLMTVCPRLVDEALIS